VLFRNTDFRPGTAQGDRLLNHELAHVVQQAQGLAGSWIDGGRSDPLEIAADRAAERVPAYEDHDAAGRVPERPGGRATVADHRPHIQRQVRPGAEIGHLERNRFNVLPTGALTPIGNADPSFKYKEGGSNSYQDEAGLIWELEPDWKTEYHQPEGHKRTANPYPNKKLLHRDASGGSAEAIRRPDGSYITTGPLRGTYNFVHPEGPLGYVGHFFRDILPHEIRSRVVPGPEPNPYVEYPPLDPKKVDVNTYRQRYESQIEPIDRRQETNITDPYDRTVVEETGVVWITHESGEVLVLAQATNGRLSFLRFIDKELESEALAQGQARQPRGVQHIPGKPPYIFEVPASVPPNAARH
jgi:hypothetical protein